MPRLNYGTLLENIVVVESTRLCLEQLAPEAALGFAASFAMPPLTRCWCKAAEDGSNPFFNHAFLARLAARDNPRESLQSMWSLCIKNRPNVPVREFHQTDGMLLYESGGPNGALLASLLALQSEREIHLWVNDNAERYGKVASAGSVGDSVDAFEELKAAGMLLGVAPVGSSTHALGWFPDTISRLGTWLTEGRGRSTGLRVGFLDPDNYAEGEAQVSSFDHRQWLRALATDCGNVLSAMFSGCQNRGRVNARRNQRLALFHSDELGLYPQSLVFEYGNFQTGVKIRWPENTRLQLAARLRHRIEATWQTWSESLGQLTVHVDGQSPN